MPPLVPALALTGATARAEGNGGATVFTYTVTRTISAGPVTVPWSFAAGSTGASDFTGGTLPPGGVVSLADGAATGTFTVSVNGDTTFEGDESFTVSIGIPDGYGTGVATSATGTILNDDPAVALFTAPVLGATRFGAENNFLPFSGSNSATAANGAGLLGTSNLRAISLNTPNMPASGDLAYALFLRTAASGAASIRQEIVLGVAGQSASGGSGGQFGFKSTVIQTGSTATGVGLDTTNAGRITARRQSATGWQWWPQTTIGADLPGIQLAADTSYLCVIGIEGSYPRVVFVDLASGTVQSATGATALSGTRPAAALFNLLGGLGSGGDRQGYGGDAQRLVVVHGGAFPSNAQTAVAAAAGPGALSALAATVGGTLAYDNALDYAAQSGGTLASTTGTAATVLSGTLGLEPVRGFKTAGVTIDRLGARWVFPLAPAASAGKAWFEGSAPAGATVVCFLRYADGTSSVQVRVTADGGGRYVASIDTPKAKPFYRSAGNLADLADCHHELDIMDLGFVVPTCGQSELNILYSAAWTSAADLTPVVSNNSGLSATTIPGDASGRWAAVCDLSLKSTTAHGTRRTIGGRARPDRMLGRGVWADGINEIATRIIADTGASVMFVNFSRGGHPLDQFVFDRVAFSQALVLAGSGTGPYTATVALTDATIQARFGPGGLGLLASGDAGALRVSATFRNQVRPGTFSLDLGGGVVITDTRVSDGAGTLSGPGGITGTIAYIAATGTGNPTISLTFPSTPAAISGTLSWQPKSETQDASAANKTANLNGYGVIETVDEAAKGLRFGWSMAMIWWITANITDGPNNAAVRANVTSKYELMRALLKSYVRAGVDTALADGPMMVAAKGRDTGNTTAVDNARLMAKELWASARGWVRRGGEYHDFTLDTAVSPHETYTATSGPRIARRMGAYLAGLLGGTPVAEPVFRSGAADRTSATLLTVPLASIGSGLTLAVASGGDANALSEWYVGGTIIANDATTIARIRSDGLAVELVKLSGTWATGAEANVLYVAGAPGTGTAPPASLLYDNRGGFGGNEPGLLAGAKLG